MSTRKEKGDLLEYAVHQIEKALVASYPQLAGQNVIIECKKIFNIAGIRQEADLWITVAPGTHLQAYHLIECKNHSRPIGVAEVDKLAKKRERLGAAEALLIAPRFSKDAIQAAGLFRVKFATVTEAFWPTVTAIDCTGTSHHIHHASLTFHFKNQNAREHIGPINRATACLHHGQPSNVPEIFDHIASQYFLHIHQPRELLKLEGNHSRHVDFSWEFSSGEFYISGEEVLSVDAWCAYTLEVRHGRITARFSVEGRGGFARFEYPPGTFGLEKPAIEILAAIPKRN